MSTIAQRIRDFSADLVADAFLADIHNLDGKGPNELEKLTDIFERKILGFMIDERNRSKVDEREDINNIALGCAITIDPTGKMPDLEKQLIKWIPIILSRVKTKPNISRNR